MNLLNVRAIVLFACATAGATFAQPPAPAPFEVATIKLSQSTAPGPGIGLGAGRLTLTNFTLKDLMVYAYWVHPS